MRANNFSIKIAIVIALLFFVFNSEEILPRKDHVSALHRPYRHKLKEDVSRLQPQWFEDQVIDHFTPGFSGKFKQRYYVNDTYFGGDGAPVFLILGGEGPISPSDVIDHFIISTYAEQFGALVLDVEHRFYGETQPFNNTSVANLKYLTTPQALADFAVFQAYIVEKYQIPNSKWVVWGGSYSGNLAAWMRLQYPHLFVGSIASSAPVKATLDFSQYLVTVGADLGSECYNAFSTATQQIVSMLQTSSGVSQLEQIFHTCSPIGNSSNDIAMFMESIADAPCGIAQYNNDNNDYEPFNLTTMCSQFMLNASYSSSLEAWGALSLYYSQFNGGTCTDVSYESYIKELSLTDILATSGRSWTWQTCTEFGYFQTGSAPNQPFSDLITLDFFLSICKDVFGEEYSVPNIDWTNEFFGSTNIAGTRIVFANGSVDPWHNLGLWEMSPANPFEFPYEITGTAHCADLYPARPSDVPQLTQCRDFQVSKIQTWLA